MSSTCIWIWLSDPIIRAAIHYTNIMLQLLIYNPIVIYSPTVIIVLTSSFNEIEVKIKRKKKWRFIHKRYSYYCNLFDLHEAHNDYISKYMYRYTFSSQVIALIRFHSLLFSLSLFTFFPFSLCSSLSIHIFSSHPFSDARLRTRMRVRIYMRQETNEWGVCL